MGSLPKKTCGCKTCIACKEIKEKVNSPMKSGLEKNQQRKDLMCLLINI